MHQPRPVFQQPSTHFPRLDWTWGCDRELLSPRATQGPRTQWATSHSGSIQLHTCASRFYRLPSEPCESRTDSLRGDSGAQLRPMMLCSGCPAMPLQRGPPNNWDPLPDKQNTTTTTRLFLSRQLVSGTLLLCPHPRPTPSPAHPPPIAGPAERRGTRPQPGFRASAFCALFFSPPLHHTATASYAIYIRPIPAALRCLQLPFLVCIPLIRPPTAHVPWPSPRSTPAPSTTLA